MGTKVDETYTKDTHIQKTKQVMKNDRQKKKGT